MTMYDGEEDQGMSDIDLADDVDLCGFCASKVREALVNCRTSPRLLPSDSSYKEKAIDCVANIPVHWNTDGSVKQILVDAEDATVIVEALIEAKLLKED
jgi:hypothetical protein